MSNADGRDLASRWLNLNASGVCHLFDDELISNQVIVRELLLAVL